MLPTLKQNEPFSVLIVDSSSVNPAFLKKHCSHVIWSKDRQEMLSFIQSIAFKLILLNLNSDGLALIKLIQAVDCINQQTPVIGLIDASMNVRKQSIIDAGFDDCLMTPFKNEQIDELFNLWQIARYNTEASGYIDNILNKTYNNRVLALTILNKLFDELPRQLAAIETALINNQYNVAEETTHKLHGSVSLCGFIDMEKPANALESSLINKNYQAINPHFQLLQQSILSFTGKQSAILSHLDKL